VNDATATVQVNGVPAVLSGGTFTALAVPLQPGSNTLLVTATDPVGNVGTASIPVTFTLINRPPVITSTPVTTVVEGQPYSYDVEATDPDAGDVLTFSLDIAPAGMTINATTGVIHWTPVNVKACAAVTVRVQDTRGLADTQPLHRVSGQCLSV